MKYFSVPADFKKETIDAYDALNQAYPGSKVIETYGQITIGNICGSGRPAEGLNKVDLKALKGYLEYSRQKNIDFNYTLNPSCLGNKEFSKEGIYEIKIFLDKLAEAGVRSLTVTLPSLMEIIKTLGYDFSIKASAICQISNANRAVSYKTLGADRIVVDIPVHRDIEALKSIRKAFGERVEIIVNTLCQKNCIYTMFHYNESSHDLAERPEKASITYFPYRCVMRSYQDNSNFIRINWIRPEDLNYYAGIGINYFKIQGRHVAAAGDPARTLECYFKESHEGNLLDLLYLFSRTNKFPVFIDNKKLDGFIKPFFEIPHFCKNDCSSCRYCEGFAQKSIQLAEAGKISGMAQKFYNECDHFLQTIHEVKNETTARESMDRLLPKSTLAFDFDLDQG